MYLHELLTSVICMHAAHNGFVLCNLTRAVFVSVIVSHVVGCQACGVVWSDRAGVKLSHPHEGTGNWLFGLR